MDVIKAPQGLRNIQEKYDLTDQDIERLSVLPRLSKLNPNYLILAYTIINSREFDLESTDLLNDEQVYNEETLGNMIKRYLPESDRKNMYRLKVELLSYITKMAIVLQGRQAVMFVGEESEELEEEEEEISYNEEEYATPED